MKRTQIYLGEAQAAELIRRSALRSVTVSHLIREAIEFYLSDEDDDDTELARQRGHLKEAFGSVPRLPSGAQYVEDIRRSDETRDDRLEERWRSG